MAERRRYTKRQKAEAVGAAEVVGVLPAAEALGIPETNIREWRERPEYAELRAEKREDVAQDVWAGFQAGVRRIVELLPDTTDMAKVAIATGVLFDKYALMSGQVTSRHETVTDSWNDHEKVALHEAIRDALAQREEVE